MTSHMLLSLLVVWAVITTALILAVIYRSIVSMKREGQLFLDPGEAHLEAEQQEILKKLDMLRPVITWLSVISGILILVVGALWLYQGFNANPYNTP
jgi:hypothetical protein